MLFFVYCRDAEGTAALRKATTEAHWAFMDRYAASMIARGPTLAADGTTPTGSMHILDLPDEAAARVFAFDEPFYRAGVFREVMIRRWHNALGRTMWQAPPAPDGSHRFLLIGHGRPGAAAAREEVVAAQTRWLAEQGHDDRIIVRGPLLAEDGKSWVGSAILVAVPDRAAAEALTADSPYARAGLYERAEILPWRPGGRH
ncbi:MAG: hypothetical protein KGI51_06480 [Rhodospirillales bacterium]|nr:hypothetical protein [Rhodospirillales bacterium]